MNTPPVEPSSETSGAVRIYWHLPAHRPYVTYLMLASCILIYLGQMLSQSLFGGDLLIALGAKVNSAILQGQYWRLFTPMWLHGSILHLAFNMYALYVIGSGLERYYGHGRYLALYVLSGYAGNVVSFLMSPEPSVGSSTAIFGLLAAEAVFIYQNRHLFQNARGMLVNIGGILLVNLILGLSPQIDNWGHLGGLIGGLAFAWSAGPVW
ncbi:MAG: rhomboid family intramembrane serine protease, partial [Thermanaerothrix sp.]|nr:rhomboid family intramembrane serine protease [Thermanaerothrix sp.]